MGYQMNIIKLYKLKQKELILKMDRSEKIYNFYSMLYECIGYLAPVLAIVVFILGIILNSLITSAASIPIIFTAIFFIIFFGKARNAVDAMNHGRKKVSQSKLEDIASWMEQFPELSTLVDRDFSVITNNQYQQLKKRHTSLNKSFKRKEVENKIRTVVESNLTGDSTSTSA